MDDLRAIKNPDLSAIRILCLVVAVAAIVGSRMEWIEPMVKRLLINLSVGGMGTLTTYQKIQREGVSQKAIFSLILFVGLLVLLLL